MRRFVGTTMWLRFLAVAVVSVCVGAQATDSESGDSGIDYRFVHATTMCDETRDGAGVRVHRCLGGNDRASSGVPEASKSTASSGRPTLDPILVFDAYRNNHVSQFQGGFPAHPHRGFLEIRYLRHGALAHNDSCGNSAVTTSGGMQALFTGSGIVHEEMPVLQLPPQPEDLVACGGGSAREDFERQVDGALDVADGCQNGSGACIAHLSSASSSLSNKCEGQEFRGFQIWLNVPQAMRSERPSFLSFRAADMPRVSLRGGAEIVLLSGRWPRGEAGSSSSLGKNAGDAEEGPLSRYFPSARGALLAEIVLPFHQRRGDRVRWITHKFIPRAQHVVLYVVEGSIVVGEMDEEPLTKDTLAYLSPGTVVRFACVAAPLADADRVRDASRERACRVLLLSAARVREPVFVSGGFVGGSAAEVRQAFSDLEAGTVARC